MGVEVVGFEAVEAPVGTMHEGENSVKENGKSDLGAGRNEPIKFGSHGNELVKNKANEASVHDVPKDAADEWPAPKQIHYFYFVRHRRYEDPKIGAKIEKANIEVGNKNKDQSLIVDALRAKRAERDNLISQIRDLINQSKGMTGNFEKVNSEKVKSLREDLKKLPSTEFSSEADLNSRIQELEYAIQHESIPLSEEKKKIKEIRSLESTRKQVREKAAVLAQLEELVPKETRQEQDKLKREQGAISSRIKQLEDALTPIRNELESLEREWNIANEKSGKSWTSFKQLKNQKYEGNADYFQSRDILKQAQGLVAINDVKALGELCHAEVEKFMSLWNSSKSFRDDYEKKILQSLDSRQLSRDGRIRNPDEKPLMAVEASKARELETASKANSKPVREDTKSAPSDTLPLPVQKEAKDKATVGKSTEEHIGTDKEVVGSEKQTKENTPKDNKVDAAKLKEMKRLEEIEKNKQALERKKKKAEKDAAKAALRAQKEVAKKLKELEKKAKKKASSALETPNPEEPAEPAAEAAEAEKVSENVEAPVSAKAKVQKDNNLRSRGRARGPDSLPKTILKRKKPSVNYWLWAAPVAFLVVLFLALGYYYLL